MKGKGKTGRKKNSYGNYNGGQSLIGNKKKYKGVFEITSKHIEELFLQNNVNLDAQIFKQNAPCPMTYEDRNTENLRIHLINYKKR